MRLLHAGGFQVVQNHLREGLLHRVFGFLLAQGIDQLVIFIDTEHTVRVNKQSLEFRNTNLLVDKPNWEVTVQKTGYIAEAGRCLVMEAVIDGRDVVIVLLNSWGRLTRIGDANRIRTWMEAGRAMPDPG